MWSGGGQEIGRKRSDAERGQAECLPRRNECVCRRLWSWTWLTIAKLVILRNPRPIRLDNAEGKETSGRLA